MMKMNSMRKMLLLIGCIVLTAAMALSFTGCGSSTAPETTAAQTAAAAETTFTFVVVDLDGNETTFEITTDKTIVGEALEAEGLLVGEEGDYGLFVHAVNGIVADWDRDQTYWAFYIDGEYALTGVDTAEIDPNVVYSMVLTKG